VDFRTEMVDVIKKRLEKAEASLFVGADWWRPLAPCCLSHANLGKAKEITSRGRRKVITEVKFTCAAALRPRSRVVNSFNGGNCYVKITKLDIHISM
jgi:hypothetical protein